jgi:threonine dehydrogenase-like Zn-dependent dehydrogenase
VRALSIVGERAVAVRDKPDPRPGPGEVLLRLKASAICGSDLHIYRRGPTPGGPDVTPGHEACGQVVEVGSGVTGWEVGDRAAVYFRRTCGACRYCLTGHNNVCADVRPGYGFAADGSDAELMVAEAGALLRLPDGLSYRDGSILACQGGTAYAPLAKLGVSGRDSLVVSGLGPVGLLSVLFGRAMGARVVGIDPAPERRALAERLGAEATLDPTAGDVVEALRAVVPGGADFLTETSGAPAAHAVVGRLVRPLGRVALVGLGRPEFATSLDALTRWEIDVVGSTIYPAPQWPEICGFVLRHGIDLRSVVGHELGIEDGPRAFELADRAEAGKVCFDLGG